jgi:cytochrome o ubiquinol oxidase subunit IV
MAKEKEQVIVSAEDAGRGTFSSYTRGYVFSIILSLMTFILVFRHAHNNAYPREFVLVSIFVLAIVQLFIQLVFFLHLGKESKPRWNLMVMLFALMVVIILVGGSVWIMNNLDYRMSPSQVNNYMNDQDGL